ncbi:unnamed protein product, partial [Protopolystoma xenopodis]
MATARHGCMRYALLYGSLRAPVLVAALLVLFYRSTGFVQSQLPLQSTMSGRHLRQIRLREEVAAGTVVIPDLLRFLELSDTPVESSSLAGGNAAASSSSLAKNAGAEAGHETGETRTESKSSQDDQILLAIGNAAMPGVSNFGIDLAQRSLVVVSPPDRDKLCPSSTSPPEHQLLMARSNSFQNNGASRVDLFNSPGSAFPHDLAGLGLKDRMSAYIADCPVSLSIIHGLRSDPSFSLIIVLLEDINDHAPSFADHLFSANRSRSANLKTGQDEFVIHVKESSRRPVRVSLPLARDADSPQNSVQSYHLDGDDAYLFRLWVGPGGPAEEGGSSGTGQADNDSFSIGRGGGQSGEAKEPNQLWLGLATPDLLFTGQLGFGHFDREQRAEYRLVLVAQDGGVPSRSGRLPVHIYVDDINDHLPQFGQTIYHARVAENDPPGHLVLRFTAADADATGPNNRITFNIPGLLGSSSESWPADQQVESRRRRVFSQAQLAAAELFSVEVDNSPESGRVDFPEMAVIGLESSPRAGLTEPAVTHGRLVVRRHGDAERWRTAAAKAILAARRQLFVEPEAGHLPSSSSAFGQLEFRIEAVDQGVPQLT